MGGHEVERAQGPRRSGPQPDRPTASDWGLYSCSHCGRLLRLEMVVSADVERSDGVATGYITFQHSCPCDPSLVRTSRGWGSHPSFLALFGTQPPLPYRAPFQWHGVAQDDPALARWRWELGQVADSRDFLLFADDAARRQGR